MVKVLIPLYIVLFTGHLVRKASTTYSLFASYKQYKSALANAVGLKSREYSGQLRHGFSIETFFLT